MKRTKEELLKAIPTLSEKSKDDLLAQMLGVARASENVGTIYSEVIFEAFNEITDKEELKNETA